MKNIQEIVLEELNKDYYTNPAIKLMTNHWYKTIEDMLNDNKKIMRKTETNKTENWYTITMIPYLENII